MLEEDGLNVQNPPQHASGPASSEKPADELDLSFLPDELSGQDGPVQPEEGT